MPSPRPVPSPEAFRPRDNHLSTAAWIAGLVLAAFGVLFAVVDVSEGIATRGAADSSFTAPPAAVEPDLVMPAHGRSHAAPATSKPEDLDPLAHAAAQAARDREAELLIERLQAELRAEREARRAKRPGASGR